MAEKRFSIQQAQHYYDFWAKGYQLLSSFESAARSRALSRLELSPGLKVMDVGMGTGAMHQGIEAEIYPTGVVFGLDISLQMLKFARGRDLSPVLQADAARQPFPSACFDRLFCSYVLDLVPLSDIPSWLAEFRRIVKPGGRMVLVFLTSGTTRLSRAVVSVWNMVFSITPMACGGCRPLDLRELISEADFKIVSHEVIVEFGIPSAVVVAS